MVIWQEIINIFMIMIKNTKERRTHIYSRKQLISALVDHFLLIQRIYTGIHNLFIQNTR